jgi:hypothetical protein
MGGAGRFWQAGGMREGKGKPKAGEPVTSTRPPVRLVRKAETAVQSRVHGCCNHHAWAWDRSEHDNLRRPNQVFSGAFGFHSLQLAASLDGRAGLAAGQLVSGIFLSVLGVRASIGRQFSPEDDRVPGGDRVAVISYGYWKRQFGLDPAAVGRSRVLNGTPFTIVGATSGYLSQCKQRSWMASRCSMSRR